MSEQRQTFHFRLPWSAAPRHSQAVQAPPSPVGSAQPAAPTQRRPFRPGGPTSPSTGQPPARNELPPASPSPTRIGSSSRATTRSASQRKIAPPPKGPHASPSRAVPQTQSPSPSRGDSQQAISIEANPLSREKKQPPTTNNTELKKEQREQNKSRLSPEKTQFRDTTLKGKDESLAFEEKKRIQSQVSVPEPESDQESRKEVYEASSEQPKEILKGMSDEDPKNKPIDQEKGQGSKAEPEGHPAAVLNDLSRHPREEVFDRKETVKILGSKESPNKSESFGHEKSRHARTGEKDSLDKEIKEDLHKIIHKLGTSRDKYALYEKPFSVITLAGENTGATMHLSSKPDKRETPIHIHRGYKARLEENVDPVAHGEGSSRGRKHVNTKVEEELGRKLHMNNNAQGINNSLIINSSVTERNPGAHVVLSQKLAEPVKTGKELGAHETHKAEVSTTPAERHTYTPNIRRRCLRGLFLEPSDSDPENSGKPRRHGCRAECPKS